MKAEAFEKHFPLCDMDKRVQYSMAAPCMAGDMGLAPGGKMKQDIYEDPFRLSDWDHNVSSRCYVHIANSLIWRAITGENPPTTPVTAKEYNDHGLPWFDYYDDQASVLEGSAALAQLKSIIQKAKELNDNPLPENEPVEPGKVKVIKKIRTVREGRF
jgi:hypothetical protein